MKRNNIKILFKILKLSATPPSIVYPIPLVPILAFALSSAPIEALLYVILFSAFYCSAANLWNHLNDAEIDIKFGRKDSEILLKHKYGVVVLVLILYSLPALLLLLYSHEQKISIMLYFFSVLATWLYSDKIYIGKILKFRLKEHYATEIATYIVVLPVSSLALWSLCSEIDSRGLAFSLLVTAVYFSGVVLKDLKDISADSEAGYKTLSVVLPPVSLLKLSVLLSCLYYFLVFIFIVSKIFPPTVVVAILPIVGFLYSIYKFIKTNWKITLSSVRQIQLYVLSYVLSLAFACIGAFYGRLI